MKGNVKSIGSCVGSSSKEGKKFSDNFVQSVLFWVLFRLKIKKSVFI